MVTSSLASLLRPVLTWAFNRGLRLGDILEVTKSLLVEIAAEQIREVGQEPSDSRISLVTGVHRGDVSRLKRDRPAPNKGKHDVITRIFTVWQQDKSYAANGLPKPLTYEGERSQFFRLVRRVTKELSPYSILLEMERTGVVRYEGAKVMLMAQDYAPKGDTEALFALVGHQMKDLIDCTVQNIEEDSPQNLHLTTYFDNIRDDAVVRLREYLVREGTLLHDKVRAEMSAQDLDIAPDPTASGGNRVAFTAFSIVELRKEPKIIERRRKPGRKKRSE